MMSTPFRHPMGNAGRTDVLKPPKAPDRPNIPYMRFSRKMWSKVRADNPNIPLWEIGKRVGQLWRDAPESEKAVYQQEYEIDKVEYEKAMKNYHNSHAYQQYMAAKNRAKINEKNSRARIEAGGVVIQPVDEDDFNNDLTCRRVAAVRYDRNHRLIAELFSPAMVSDTRTIVAQTRMDMLKKQAQSLNNHLSKLGDELTTLAEVHIEKKRQIEKNSEDFAENLKKVCEERPQLDESKFNDLVEEWTGKLATAYEDYKKKQDEINAKIAADREKMVEETPVLAELVMGKDEEKKEEEGKSTEEEKKDEEKSEDAGEEQPNDEEMADETGQDEDDEKSAEASD